MPAPSSTTSRSRGPTPRSGSTPGADPISATARSGTTRTTATGGAAPPRSPSAGSAPWRPRGPQSPSSRTSADGRTRARPGLPAPLPPCAGRSLGTRGEASLHHPQRLGGADPGGAEDGKDRGQEDRGVGDEEDDPEPVPGDRELDPGELGGGKELRGEGDPDDEADHHPERDHEEDLDQLRLEDQGPPEAQRAEHADLPLPLDHVPRRDDRQARDADDEAEGEEGLEEEEDRVEGGEGELQGLPEVHRVHPDWAQLPLQVVRELRQVRGDGRPEEEKGRVHGAGVAWECGEEGVSGDDDPLEEERLRDADRGDVDRPRGAVDLDPVAQVQRAVAPARRAEAAPAEDGGGDDRPGPVLHPPPPPR